MKEKDLVKQLKKCEIDILKCSMIANYLDEGGADAYIFVYFNFKKILDTFKLDIDVSALVRLLVSNGYGQIVANNFMTVFKKVDGNRIYELVDLTYPFNSAIIKENIQQIFDASKDSDIVELLQVFRKYNLLTPEFIEQFQAKEDVIIKSMLEKPFSSRYEYCDYDKIMEHTKEYLPTFNIMVKELLKHEGKTITDVCIEGEGFFSRTYGIGDKVLKLGVCEENKKVKNHRRILQPLYRATWPDDDAERTDREKMFIEVEERVTTADEFPEEEMYELYKDLRDSGTIWTDVKPNNVGRLRKSNRVHYRHTTGVSPDAVGFDRSLSEDEILPAGKLVIFDKQFLYDENDPNITYLKSSKYTMKFKRRYEQELEERNQAQNDEPDFDDK